MREHILRCGKNQHIGWKVAMYFFFPHNVPPIKITVQVLDSYVTKNKIYFSHGALKLTRNNSPMWTFVSC